MNSFQASIISLSMFKTNNQQEQSNTDAAYIINGINFSEVQG
jgi:hypothetical protein